MIEKIKHIPGAYIADSADVMGDVEMKKNSSIWYQAVVRGDADRIVIGEGSNVQDGTVIHTDIGYPVTIGDYVTIGHNAIIHGCTIEDGALIGMGAIVLNGAVIGKNAVVGAGALVTAGTIIPEGMMAIGSPAKVKKAVPEEMIAHNRGNAELYITEAKEHFE